MRRQTSSRRNEPPMPEPLAYFLTWTTYGTWLPGDERGWVKQGKGFQAPDMRLVQIAANKLAESPCTLSSQQREIVEETIREHCRIRGWTLYAVNCRSNHVHVVVEGNKPPKKIRDEFEAWCTRTLKEQQASVLPGGEVVRERWWTEKGSGLYLNDAAGLDAAIVYVDECQDIPPGQR